MAQILVYNNGICNISLLSYELFLSEKTLTLTFKIGGICLKQGQATFFDSGTERKGTERNGTKLIRSFSNPILSVPFLRSVSISLICDLFRFVSFQSVRIRSVPFL